MRWKIGTIIFVTCTMFGCGDFDVVDKSKQVVLPKEEYDQLKAAAALGKQVGRYQIHREGLRTWRLDTATGHNCLLLTTEADWNSAAGKKQNSCAEEDLVKAQ